MDDLIEDYDDPDVDKDSKYNGFLEAIEAYKSQGNNPRPIDEFVERIRKPDDSDNDFFISIDTHLKSPLLTVDPMDYILDYQEGDSCFPHRNLIKAINESIGSVKRVETHLDGVLYRIFQELMVSEGVKDNQITINLKDLIIDAYKVYSISSEHWYKVPAPPTLLGDLMKNIPKSLTTWFTIFEKFTRIKQFISSLERKQKDIVEVTLQLTLVGQYFIWRLANGRGIVLKTNYLIAALDIGTMQFNCRLISYLTDVLNPSPIPLYPMVDLLSHIMENISKRAGNDAFRIFKSIEPLIVGKCLNVLDEGLNNELYDSTVQDLTDKNLFNHCEPLLSFIDSYCHVSFGQKHLLNLCGMAKSWGNPTIDSIKGIQKLKELTRVRKVLDKTVLDDARVMFRKRFCKEYFRKHGVFPNVVLNDLTRSLIHPKLLSTIDSRRWFNEDAEPKLTTSDWLSFKFSKTLPFDYVEDIEKLLSDKAISPPLENWSQDYCKCAFRRSGQKRPKFNHSTTRLLNYILESDQPISVEKLFKVVDNREVPRSWKRIKLMDKELELNDIGRKFSTQTPMIRIWQTVSEHNVANGIMKYLNYQSMTIGEIQTEQRVTAMAKLQSSDLDYGLYFMNFDLEKWNMCFRWETIFDIAEDMDNIFGMSRNIVYSHEFFSDCVFTYPSTVAPIVGAHGMPLESNGCHVGQPGGCEGLRQKVWTAVTAGVIDSCAEKLGIPISLLCQGDNQTILAKIRKGEEHQISALLVLIETNLTKVGMKLKREETWVSRNLVSYSKKFYLKGVAVDDFIKPSIRVCGSQNSDFPCLLNEIGTISTGGESVAKSGSNPAAAFILASMHSILHLRREFKFHPESNDLYALMFSTPIIGCYPVSPFSNYCLRGTPDPLTDFISRFKFVDKKYRKISDSMRKLLNLEIGSKESLINIVKDPLSLNLRVPLTPVVGIEILLKGILRRRIKYPRYRLMYDLHTQDMRRDFLEKLVGVDKLFPVVLNKVYSLSPYGIIDRLEARFDNTNSLIKMICKDYSFGSLKEGIDVFVRDHRRSIIKRLFRGALYSNPLTSIIDSDTCPFLISSNLRKRTWGIEIFGVTMPCPADQITIKPWNEVTEEETGWTITARLSERSRQVPLRMHYEVGPFVPYLGSETSEKIQIVKTPTGRLLTSSSMDNLRKMFVWLSQGVGPNMKQTLKNIIVAMIPQEFGDESCEVLRRILNSQDIEVFGGCWTHRMSSSVINSGCYLNQKYTPSSHIQYSPTMATNICRGAANRTIFFQNVQIYATSVLSHYAMMFSKLYPSFALVVSCPTCTNVITEETFDLTSPIEINLRTPFTVFEVEIVSENSCNYMESSNLEPLTSLSYYLACKCRSDFDLFIRAQDTQKGLHTLISTMSPASQNYNKTEIASCNIMEVLKMIIFIYPEIRDHISQLSNVVANSTELLIKSSSWIPLLGLASAMIGTDRIRLLIVESGVSNNQFLLGFHKYRVVSLLYQALRKLCNTPIDVVPILHLTEIGYLFCRRLRSMILKYTPSDEPWAQQLLSMDRLSPSVLFGNEELYSNLKKYIFIIKNVESCLFRWRTAGGHYTHSQVSLIKHDTAPLESNSVELTFQDYESEFPIEQAFDSLPTPRDPDSLYVSPIHHYHRHYGNISTSCHSRQNVRVKMKTNQ